MDRLIDDKYMMKQINSTLTPGHKQLASVVDIRGALCMQTNPELPECVPKSIPLLLVRSVWYAHLCEPLVERADGCEGNDSV